MITKLSLSLIKLAKKYNLAASTISNALKTLNINVINEQNMLRFNEHVFDIIDTEEKAY
jgi:carbonic anhydrase